MEKSNCKGCTERFVGCHSSCDRYKSYRKRLDDFNASHRDAKKKAYGECDDYKRDILTKAYKKKKY